MLKPREFEGKVALVTGAGRGLGRAISVGFSAYGAIVAANDITPVNLDRTMQIIYEQGGQGRDYVVDISKKMLAQNLVDEVLMDYGRIDMLINNAAVDPQVPLLDLDEWDWRRAIDVNLNAPFLLIQLVGRAMCEHGGGVIVNITGSHHDQLGRKFSAFTASKQGLVGLTRAAATELAQYHIRVNGVLPYIPQPTRAGQDDASLKEESTEKADAGDKETVRQVLYLCSQSAESINGVIYDGSGMIWKG